MIMYLAFYVAATGAFLYELYTAYLRRAPVIESEILIKNYTTLVRKRNLK